MNQEHAADCDTGSRAAFAAGWFANMAARGEVPIVRRTVIQEAHEEWQTTALEDDGRLPCCEGWTCQSCGADNFIPDGFARVLPPGVSQ